MPTLFIKCSGAFCYYERKFQSLPYYWSKIDLCRMYFVSIFSSCNCCFIYHYQGMFSISFYNFEKITIKKKYGNHYPRRVYLLAFTHIYFRLKKNVSNSTNIVLSMWDYAIKNIYRHFYDRKLAKLRQKSLKK